MDEIETKCCADEAEFMWSFTLTPSYDVRDVQGVPHPPHPRTFHKPTPFLAWTPEDLCMRYVRKH